MSCRIKAVEVWAWISLLACRHLEHPIPYFSQYGMKCAELTFEMCFNNTVTRKQFQTQPYLKNICWKIKPRFEHVVSKTPQLFIYACILYSKSIDAPLGGGCSHILNHTCDWWMAVLKPFESCLVQRLERKSYTSLKRGMPLCCDVKWHYPKDMWCDFVKVWTMNCVGGGMYKGWGNLPGLQFTAD